ncbi:type III-B CRISPR module RAMP protein Cmr6 [Thermococcus henrietii]|uniref:type III-B CRISPR module RAMP protein Cmr6 n=1 Tax=Thermococcus henrietii TaxID=2016361 RepID=UPI001CB7838E|nr:type III-B CRISPR module RAMP protein Cmr6 [Thermococcus henrietii]
MRPGGGHGNRPPRKYKRRSKNAEPPRYVVPKDSITAIRNPIENVSNLSLLLQKYAPFVREKGAYKATVSMLKRLNFKPSLENVIEDYAVYLDTYLRVVAKAGRTFVLETRSRLVAGLGDESVYETSIRLLRNYGVPYIPGSALKGVTKAWAVEMMTELLGGADGFKGDSFERAKEVQGLLNAGETEKFPEAVGLINPSRHLVEFLNALGVEAKPGSVVNARELAERLVRIFGTTTEGGSAVFFDALPSPVKAPTDREKLISQLRGKLKDAIEFDIMNPHYGPYYQKGEAPGDWHSPVPVLFLTVRKGVPFVFAVGGDERGVAEKLLRLALRHHGVGAKTSLGYGRFH